MSSAPTPSKNPSMLRRLFTPITMISGPWTRANGISWLKLVIFILVLRWAFFELYSIPSGSMEPVLHGDPGFFKGDRVAVNKALFGPRVPFTTKRIFPLDKPRRWDIVVFNAVDPEAEHPILIKRVVGLPGERIRIRNGQIFVNGEPVEPPEHLREILFYTTHITPPRQFIRDYIFQLGKYLNSIDDMDMTVYGADILARDLLRLNERLDGIDLESLRHEQIEEFAGLISPLSYQMVGENLARESGLKSNLKYGIRGADEFSLVPEGHYLMLGDNSGNSADGRSFGWVPHKNLYGRAFAVALPFSRMKDLTGFSKTWWGKLLLFGLPLGLVAFELLRARWAFSWRVHEDHPSLGLRDGDHVWISRRAFGLSVPFSRKRMLFRRTPSPGETWAYLSRGKNDHSPRLLFGRYQASADTGFIVDGLGRDGSGTKEIRSERVIGRVVGVWWPLARRRKVKIEPRGASS